MCAVENQRKMEKSRDAANVKEILKVLQYEKYFRLTSHGFWKIKIPPLKQKYVAHAKVLLDKILNSTIGAQK